MTVTRLRFAFAAALLATVAAARPTAQRAAADVVDPRLYGGLAWRNLGPFRAGRVAAVTGVVGQPAVFYIGLPAGGVWKTTSAGEVWYPVFDGVSGVSSVGAVEVAPSDPNVVWAGTGDMITGGAINEGNGVWRSDDAGRSWRHVGLAGSKQIPSMLVDVRDPNTVLVAAQGDIHVKSGDRGVFRTSDGGATWARTLFADDSTGVQKLARATDVPQVVFATTVAHYVAPPAATPSIAPPVVRDSSHTGTALYKSLDGGLTWREIAGGGLPRLAGRTSVAVAMHTNAQRVFLIGNAGLFRSDDGGTTWRPMAADDPRIRNGQGGYNCGVYVDPTNPDIVYTINTSSYRSTDGGRTFTGFKGAPGGDDPQQLWIDPTNGDRMLLGLDQGAVVTLDAGRTWSSWFNQSTEQIYHLAVDASYPAWVYGTQQDAGAIRTRLRGKLGAITPLDWSPVPGWEWGTIRPDPLDVNTVYSSGSGILKISYPSEQWINVSPAADPAAKLRTTSSQPIVFAPWNRRQLIAAFQSLWSTTDGGAHWTAISPDLTVRSDASASVPGARPGAIESLTASTIGTGMLWVGTNNGLIKLTRDGGRHWTDASIPDLPSAARAEVLTVEPSHQDAATAYAVVDLHRVGDYAPYIFRTRDFGQHWTRITSGLPVGETGGSFARVVRSDPVKAGLLFAGTESGMFVSFDDGDHWQSLRQNLPLTSYRDIAIAGNDLIVATYGRGLWVLDDFTMLRQLASTVAAEPAHLFRPADAVRTRRNVGADTPFPPEVPQALNPSDGVAIDYWLARASSHPVTVEVLDAAGAVVRHLTSVRAVPAVEAARPPHPNFWVGAPDALDVSDGMHRAHWDLRHDAPPALRHSFEINANPERTPTSPEGALALPGTYTLRLTVDGQRYLQQAVVRPYPRSPATLSALRAQHDLLARITDGLRVSYAGHEAALALRTALRDVLSPGAPLPPGDVAARAGLLAARLDTVAGLDAGRARARSSQPTPPSFAGVNDALVQQLNAQDNGDQVPTQATLAAFTATCRELAVVVAAWERLGNRDLVDFNALLHSRGRAALPHADAPLVTPDCR
jgi:photosystem II stability/assembly factor-like uncharacterized protein